MLSWPSVGDDKNEKHCTALTSFLARAPITHYMQSVFIIVGLVSGAQSAITSLVSSDLM